MAYVIAPRVLRVVTTNGYSFQFSPKAVTWVPEPALAQVIAAGCIETDEHGAIKFGDEPDPSLKDEMVVEPLSDAEKSDTSKRQETIKAAIAYLVAKGDTRDFRKDNLPKRASVEKSVGFDVSQSEIQEAFLKYQEES